MFDGFPSKRAVIDLRQRIFSAPRFSSYELHRTSTQYRQMSLQIPPLSRHVAKMLPRPYVCLSCALRPLSSTRSPPRRSLLPKQQKLRTAYLSTRHASGLSSSSAINPIKEVEPAVRELYDALSDLRTKAPVWVNGSRLQLALNGLEGKQGDARIRIAGMLSFWGTIGLAD